MSNTPEVNGWTNKEILIRLETKVDLILADHESRIRRLERYRWGLPASILTALVSAGSAIAIAFIH